MMRNALTGWNRKRLRLVLALFFLALAIPTTILIYQAYSQLKWEAFHRHRAMAEELANRIDKRFIELINIEEARAFTDYAFLNVAGDPKANFLQRSPLSNYPVNSAIPGLIGYFQVDTEGLFTTPLLPPDEQQSLSYGISDKELNQRRELQDRIRQILSRNRLVQEKASGLISAMAPGPETGERDEDKREGFNSFGMAGDAIEEEVSSFDDAPGEEIEGVKQVQEPIAAQKAFDQLYAKEKELVPKKDKLERAAPASASGPTIGLGRVEDLKLDTPYDTGAASEPSPAPKKSARLFEKRSKRKEQSALPERESLLTNETPERTLRGDTDLRISIFESEIDAFEFSLLDSGHFVMFRKVWRDGQRYIQGALIESGQLINGVIESAFRNTNLSQMSNLAVALQGNLFSAFSGQSSRGYLSSAEELRGALLYQTHLSAPLSDMELIFSINHLPAGPGGKVINWVAAIIIVVLCGGFYLMYRLGSEQITLARQQQDFVSAVSHELKTPLTSIRMYGEMLREGWADEDKKRTYYDYIHDESERLSRLITNVLQLARMTRNDLQIELRPMRVDEIVDMVRSKISSYVERAGYSLNIDCDEETGEAVIQVDADYINQVIINLVDNAIKFSARSDRRDIDIACRLQRDSGVLFTVRDYGPGVAKDQMRKIFKLFYRSENELTRETVGTGIGLALAHQLVQAMNGKIDVVNREPGAEFRIVFQ